MQEEIRNGKFDVVPSDRVDSIWKHLSRIDVIEKKSVSKNLLIGLEAWKMGNNYSDRQKDTGEQSDGAGEDIANILHGEALRHWMTMHLMVDRKKLGK